MATYVLPDMAEEEIMIQGSYKNTEQSTKYPIRAFATFSDQEGSFGKYGSGAYKKNSDQWAIIQEARINPGKGGPVIPDTLAEAIWDPTIFAEDEQGGGPWNCIRLDAENEHGNGIPGLWSGPGASHVPPS